MSDFQNTTPLPSMLDDRDFQKDLVRQLLDLPTASLFDGRLGDHNRKGGGKLSIDFMVGRFVSKVCGCVDASVHDDRVFRNKPKDDAASQQSDGSEAGGYGA